MYSESNNDSETSPELVLSENHLLNMVNIGKEVIKLLVTDFQALTT